jgi:tetratricopeptide (TPR) repeat protein
MCPDQLVKDKNARRSIAPLGDVVRIKCMLIVTFSMLDIPISSGVDAMHVQRRWLVMWILLMGASMDAQGQRNDLSVSVSPVTERYGAALRAGADGNFGRARESLLLVLREDPSHTSARLRLRVLDDMDAKRIPAATAAHLFNEVLLAASGRLQKALSAGDAAIRLSPNYAEAYRLRGRTRVEMRDYDGALADYSRAIELNDGYVEAYQNRGSARLRRGDNSGALADYDEAVRRDPSSAENWLNRATALSFLHEPERALRDLDKAIELDPGLPQPYINKSEVYVREGRRREAIQVLKEMLTHVRPAFRGDIDYAKQRLKELESY